MTKCIFPEIPIKVNDWYYYFANLALQIGDNSSTNKRVNQNAIIIIIGFLFLKYQLAIGGDFLDSFEWKDTKRIDTKRNKDFLTGNQLGALVEQTLQICD